MKKCTPSTLSLSHCDCFSLMLYFKDQSIGVTLLKMQIFLPSPRPTKSHSGEGPSNLDFNKPSS